jgi:hypothetical protein
LNSVRLGPSSGSKGNLIKEKVEAFPKLVSPFSPNFIIDFFIRLPRANGCICDDPTKGDPTEDEKMMKSKLNFLTAKGGSKNYFSTCCSLVSSLFLGITVIRETWRSPRARDS